MKLRLGEEITREANENEITRKRKHCKIVIARYYCDPENESMVNLCRPSNMVLHDISVDRAKARLTREAKANGFEPTTEWKFQAFGNDWTRGFVKGAKGVTGMVHLFE